LPVPPKSDSLRVVLVGARNPLNIGAAARAMSNFGFLRLGVVNPYAVAFRQAKSAVGAAALHCVLSALCEHTPSALQVSIVQLMPSLQSVSAQQPLQPLAQHFWLAAQVV